MARGAKPPEPCARRAPSGHSPRSPARPLAPAACAPAGASRGDRARGGGARGGREPTPARSAAPRAATSGPSATTSRRRPVTSARLCIITALRVPPPTTRRTPVARAPPGRDSSRIASEWQTPSRTYRGERSEELRSEAWIGNSKVDGCRGPWDDAQAGQKCLDRAQGAKRWASGVPGPPGRGRQRLRDAARAGGGGTARWRSARVVPGWTPRKQARAKSSRRGNRSPATAATYSTPPAPGPLCAARRSISRYASSLQRARATRVTPRRGLAAGRRGAGRRARGVRWEVCVEGAAQRGFEVAASGGARRDGEAQGGAVAVGHLKRRARGLALARPPLAAGGRRPAAGPDVEVARALAPVSPAAGAERRRALARGPGGSALSSAQVRHGSAGRGESPHRPCSGRQAALRAGLAQPRPPAHRFGACVSMSREGVPRALGAGPGHAAG